MRSSLLAVAASVALAAPAVAQVVGVYQGYSADGELVAFKVAVRRDAPGLEVSEATVFVQAPCEYSKIAEVGGIDYAVHQPIRNGQARAERAIAPAFDIRFDLTFAGDGQTASGSIRTILPGLDTSRLHAERALYCIAPNQAMQVTLLAPGATPARPKTPMIYDQSARIGGRP